MVNIAHFSDLHFSKISFDPRHLFSKRLIGNINLWIGRGSSYPNEHPFSVIEKLKEEEITHVIISGDLTSTSYKKEFLLAQKFVNTLKELGIEVFVIPGNHDHYTKKADRNKIFYDYFPSKYGTTSLEIDQFSLKTHGVTSRILCEGWRLIMLDTTVSTSLFSAQGFFSPTIEKNLKHLLSLVPKDEKVLLANHFPFFQNESPKRRLLRGKELQSIIQSYPNITLYLHGHTHRRIIADLRSNGLPLILDSGSTGHIKGSWNCLKLNNDQLDLKVYEWKKSWTPIHKEIFSFDSKPWYHKGLRFKCTECGKCCTGTGFVWLEEEDIENLSQHLGIKKEEFLKKYTRQLGFDYSLLENPHTKDCIFLKNKKSCAVYKARPKQCRIFPWWPENIKSRADWEEVKKSCEGIEHEDAPLIPIEEIKKHLDE